MKSSKEFFERLQTDEVFAKEVAEKAQKKIEDGEKDYKALWTALAAEYGYEFTNEEFDELYKAAAAEMSEEELGKVAGGTTPAVLFSVCTMISVTSFAASAIEYIDEK